MTKLSDWLEKIATGIDQGRELAALRELQAGLDERRSQSPADEWRMVREALTTHRLHALLLEDPYTQRAFTKPRGIAGDAVMLDFVYGHPATSAAAAAASELGQRVLAGTAGLSPPAQAVRLRRGIAANFVERATYGRAPLQITALAAGHLREYEWVHGAANGHMRWTAIDGDPDTATVVARDYPGVECVGLDLMGWVRQPPIEPSCDCIYTLGLLDYLVDPVATRLLTAMWASLRPGGRLLAGNFLPDAPGLGFMEAAMGWKLRYRTGEELTHLAAACHGAQTRTFADAVGCCVYLEAVKN